MKAFYLEVREQLENKGMTIYRLSKETGVFEQTLHSMLNGNTSSPKLDNAVKIAKVLDIDLNKLKEWLKCNLTHLNKMKLMRNF